MSKKQTAVSELLSAIPSGAEIKQFIFDNDADEKMLDEWLWEKIYKSKDWKQMEREQIEEAFDKGIPFENGSEYYTQTYGECTHQS